MALEDTQKYRADSYTRKGCDVVLDILRTEGVTHIFGNPGTTELSLIDALSQQTEIEYVLGLQEATVVGMAEGYARASNKPAFVNLHATAGLGNGLGALSNAAYTNVPMVVTAGQQDYNHIVDDPWLTGDLVGLAKPLCKWAHEVRTPNEIGPILRRAFKDANTHPKGPVFVSLPSNFMDENVTIVPPGKSVIHHGFVAQGLEIVVEHLTGVKPGDVAVIAGDEISWAEAMDDLVSFADVTGADIYGSPLHDSVVFPTSHPLWNGALPPTADGIHEILSNYKKVFLIGDRSFMAYVCTSGQPVPDSVDLIHLSADPKVIGHTFETCCGVTGELKASLHTLTQLIDEEEVTVQHIALKQEQKHKLQQDQDAAMQESFSEAPIPPETAAFAILKALPEDAMIVDEAPATTGFTRKYHQSHARLDYNFSKGGGLGWAMPAAVGMCIAEQNRPAVCLIGDGAAMYSPQALWSAKNLQLPITYIVVNNAEYGILKNYLRNHTTGGNHESFVGMDLAQPKIDYLALGRSMGIEGVRIENAGDIQAAVEQAVKTNGPSLIEIKIAPSK